MKHATIRFVFRYVWLRCLYAQMSICKNIIHCAHIAYPETICFNNCSSYVCCSQIRASLNSSHHNISLGIRLESNVTVEPVPLRKIVKLLCSTMVLGTCLVRVCMRLPIQIQAHRCEHRPSETQTLCLHGHKTQPMTTGGDASERMQRPM